MNATQDESAVRPRRKRLNHGLSKHGCYNSWEAMISRCTNSRHVAYKDYGARGITVCASWMTFPGFFTDMGSSWKRGLSLERQNNDNGYCADNCYWATSLEQGQNKRNNHFLELNGMRLTISAWARKIGCRKSRIHKRLKLGWTTQQVLTTPVTSRPRS